MLLAAWGEHHQDGWDDVASDLKILWAGPTGAGQEMDIPLSMACTQASPMPHGPTSGSFADALVRSDCIVMVDGHLRVDDALEGPHQGHRSAGQELADAYLRWGPECAAHLRGEFAFILWDRATHRLVAATDAVGTRPLTYFFDGRLLLIASRATRLLRHPRVPRRWDRLYVASILGDFWSQPPGLTPFERIRRTRPGVALILENGALSERRMTELRGRSIGPAGSHEAVYEEFLHILGASVSRRVLRHPKVCVALSGGLDSTIVTGLAARSDGPLDAFSIVSSADADLDERAVITAFCAAHPNVRWHAVPCGLDDGLIISNSSVVTDDPLVIGHAAQSARIRLVKAMREERFQGALDGEGGDELFAMSPRLGDFVAARQWHALGRLIVGAHRRRALVWRGLVVPRLPSWGRFLWDRRERRRTRGWPPWLTPQFWAEEETHEARARLEAWARVDDSGQALRSLLEHPGFVGSHAAQRLTRSRQGVEFGSPMLDQAVIEFVMGLPPELRVSRSETKGFLREAGRVLLPEDVLAREKDQRLYRIMRNRALDRVKFEAYARLIQESEALRGRLDGARLAELLGRTHLSGELPDNLGEALYATLATARWIAALEHEYRIT